MTQSTKEKCFSLKQEGYTRKQIAETLDLSERQVKRWLASYYAEHGGYGQATGEPVPTITFANGSKIGMISQDKVGEVTRGRGFSFGLANSSFQQALHDFHRATGVPTSFVKTKEEAVPPFPLEKDPQLYLSDKANAQRESVRQLIEKQFQGKPAKILYLADIHIPFTDYRAVLAAVREHEDADILIINGDFLDLFAVSKYAKDKEVALGREMEEGRQLLEYLAGRFAYVVLTEGNHERRLRHMITNLIPADMQFLFPSDALQIIVEGTFLEKKKLQNVWVAGSWWIQLFDTIYAHPDNYSGAPMRTVISTSEHFLLVKNIPHRMCVIGHTHQAGEMIRGGIKLMETGHLQYEPDYHSGAKFTKTAWTKAHAVIYIDENGRSDLNRSRVIYL